MPAFHKRYVFKDSFGKPTENDIKDISAFNKNTTCGAIEYIIAYVKETWNCKIALYSNPYFEYKNYGYGTVVDYMKQIAAKWDIEFWNMYEDKTMSYSQFDDEKLLLYMRDWLHPTRAGYIECGRRISKVKFPLYFKFNDRLRE